MSSLELKYAAENKAHEVTRLDNDRNLLPKLETISRGLDIAALERFAKAYLGMYLDIDNSIPPQQRITILANPALAEAIRQGFESVLQHGTFPDAIAIADAMMDEQPIAIGYVLLAALDLYADEARYGVEQLPSVTIQSALCFHFAAKTEIQNRWFDDILSKRKDEITPTLIAFWQRLLERGCDNLPGLYLIIHPPKYAGIAQHVILPVLARLRQCRKRVLRDLLHAALRVCDHAELLRVSEQALVSWNRADPGHYILWLATAFLLQPENHSEDLADYCGLSKEKLLPLLDFTVLALRNDSALRLDLPAQVYSNLLRIIASKFGPQLDRYGNLSDITQQVMYLFYRLAYAPQAATAIEHLAQVRVMKLYLDILVFIRHLQNEARKMPFDAFILELQATNSIKIRKKWSDQGH